MMYAYDIKVERSFQTISGLTFFLNSACSAPATILSFPLTIQSFTEPASLAKSPRASSSSSLWPRAPV